MSSSILSSTTSTTIVFNRWSDLSDDLLDMIIHHLHNLIDFINFGAVCRTWQSSFITHRLTCRDNNCHHASSDLPWMVFLSPTENGNSLSCPLHIYCFTNKKSYHVHLPSLPASAATTDANFTFRFSSNGFLICCKYDRSSPLLAFNPLTGTHFTLPSTSTAVKQRHRVSTHNFINKAIIDKRSHYVAVICDRYSQVMFAKPGDDSWTSFDDFDLQDFIELDDIIFHDGLLYAVTEFGTTYRFDFNLSASSLPAVMQAGHTVMQFSRNNRYENHKDVEGTNFFLVESPDGVDLYLFRFAYYSLGIRTDFVLFKENKIEGKWDEVLLQSLEGLSLLLMRDSVFLLSRSQCTYLALNQPVHHAFGAQKPHFYDISDGTIRMLDLPGDLLQTPYHWFTPTLL